jgi:hypothetical protein
MSGGKKSEITRLKLSENVFQNGLDIETKKQPSKKDWEVPIPDTVTENGDWFELKKGKSTMARINKNFVVAVIY